ncbi:MAG: hypothetical protein JSS37_05940 [Proteobacteria bacterium]|nr:hypothetical protein [Pseudomonadota bacterium]
MTSSLFSNEIDIGFNIFHTLVLASLPFAFSIVFRHQLRMNACANSISFYLSAKLQYKAPHPIHKITSNFGVRSLASDSVMI